MPITKDKVNTFVSPEYLRDCKLGGKHLTYNLQYPSKGEAIGLYTILCFPSEGSIVVDNAGHNLLGEGPVSFHLSHVLRLCWKDACRKLKVSTSSLRWIHHHNIVGQESEQVPSAMWREAGMPEYPRFEGEVDTENWLNLAFRPREKHFMALLALVNGISGAYLCAENRATLRKRIVRKIWFEKVRLYHSPPTKGTGAPCFNMLIELGPNLSTPDSSLHPDERAYRPAQKVAVCSADTIDQDAAMTDVDEHDADEEMAVDEEAPIWEQLTGEGVREALSQNWQIFRPEYQPEGADEY